MENENKDVNFFEKFGLEVTSGDVEIGQTYPIYGMITKLIDDTPGNVIVEINFSIRANMAIPDQDKVELLKQRAFEPGIFVSTVKTKDPGLHVDCSTVVFGRRQQFSA
ncbi:MAG: hypothetical protein J0M12_12825 [Deltaproteobacteria bacterium]|nr:hypothetical protein [Deltaproteobacteria bacterium]